MPKSRAVGIDLGTTYSAVAWINADGHTAMIPNSDGDILTPSVVLFEDRETIVGKEAKKAAVLRVGRVAEVVKRDMGNPVYSRPIRGEYLPPEVIQACILRKLKADVLRSLGPDYEVVITVPAFFDEPRRRATAQAGDMAGLPLLDIVNEPTAAALAFGEELGYLNEKGATRERINLLVYDLGGGTFDVTLVEFQTGNVRTLATDGDVRLGGRDWDMRLVNYVSEEFIKQHREDPRQNPVSLQRLLVDIEDAKHTLSLRNKAKVRIDHAGSILDVPVTREIFERATTDLLERTATTTRQLLNAANLTWKEVTRILLVGGATRMPMVERTLKELSGITPDHTVHPDEAIARGAALFAHYRLATKDVSDSQRKFHITDVNAHSLGIEGIDPETLRKRNKIIIPRNTPLPARVERDFITRSAGQASIVIQVLEGESPVPSECTAIGRTVIRNLPSDLPQGSPVDVTFEYATNGRLNVRAKVRNLNREVTMEMECDSSLSPSRLKQWRRALDAPAGGIAGGASGNTCGFDGFESLIAETMQEIASNQARREAAANLPPGATPILVQSPDKTPSSSATAKAPASAAAQSSAAPWAGSSSTAGATTQKPAEMSAAAARHSPNIGGATFGEDLDEILEQGIPPSMMTNPTLPPTSVSSSPGSSLPPHAFPSNAPSTYLQTSSPHPNIDPVMPVQPALTPQQFAMAQQLVLAQQFMAAQQMMAASQQAAMSHPAGHAAPYGQPPAASFDPSAEESHAISHSSAPRPRRSSGMLRTVVWVVGLLGSSALGLAMGYYVLCCLYPSEYNTYGLPIPAAFQPAEEEKPPDVAPDKENAEPANS